MRAFRLVLLLIAVAIVAHRPLLLGAGRLIYPYPYRAVVERHAAHYGLDPLLVVAVMRTESGFDPSARSGAGARGLMQLMPRTATWAARQAGIKRFAVDELEDPETNIRLGCWYLAYLWRQYEGDLSLVLAAYNGGEGNVAKWRQAGGLNAGFPETRRYVKRGQRCYQTYRWLYAEGD